MAKINLDRDKIDQCREMAEALLYPAQKYIDYHSTVSVEKATLRLLGFTGLIRNDSESLSFAEAIVSRIDKKKLPLGACTWVAAAKIANPKLPLEKLAARIYKNETDLNTLPEPSFEACMQALKPWIDEGLKRLDQSKRMKDKGRYQFNQARGPLIGIDFNATTPDEARENASKAVDESADVVCFLADENKTQQTAEEATLAPLSYFLRGIRDHLFDLSDRKQTYIRLGQKACGLHLPEMAAVCAHEQVDIVYYDPIDDILFGNTNLKRALVDQYFSTIILARSGTMLATREEDLINAYESFDQAPLTLALHFIQEQFAKNAGLRDEQMGLTSVFKLPPEEDAFVGELAFLSLVRDIFPRSPLQVRVANDAEKTAHLLFLYKLAGIASHQSFQYFNSLEDLKDTKKVYQSSVSLFEEIQYNTNGSMARKARTIVDEAFRYLQKIKTVGFLESLEQGLIAGKSASRDGGQGLDGVFEKSRRYFNPFLEKLEVKE